MRLALAPTGYVFTGYAPVTITAEGQILTGQAANEAYWAGDYIFRDELPSYSPVYGNIGLLNNSPTNPPSGPQPPQGPPTPAKNPQIPQQPSKVSERLERLKNCALGYYGIDPLSVAGLSSDAKWGLIAAAAGGIPKAVPDALGMRVIMLPGSSRFTSVLSMISVAGGGGTLRTIANFGSKWAGPIAIASAVIDATAIGICTASD
jgi:hypothetical protein